MLGVSVCAFPQLTPNTGYNYGCRCPRCKVWRKRYDGRRVIKPRRRGQPERNPSDTPAPPPPRSAPKRPRQRRERYIGPCRCEHPQPRFIPIFGGHECAGCGMPYLERTTE